MISGATLFRVGPNRRIVRGLGHRLSRIAVLTVVAAGLFLAFAPSAALARPPKADNSKLMATDEGESYVAGYFILIVGLGIGLTAVCRKNYRTTEIKKTSGEK